MPEARRRVYPFSKRGVIGSLAKDIRILRLALPFRMAPALAESVDFLLKGFSGLQNPLQRLLIKPCGYSNRMLTLLKSVEKCASAYCFKKPFEVSAAEFSRSCLISSGKESVKKMLTVSSRE